MPVRVVEFTVERSDGASMRNSKGMPIEIALPDVPFLPWIGDNYASSPIRLLVLGESHYNSKPTEQPTNKYTIETWDEYLKDPTGKFWTNIVQVVSSKAKGECDINNTVHGFAFYNYCNKIVGAGPRIAPSSTAWKESRPDFDLVLDFIKPTHILVLGQRLWNNLKEDAQGAEVKIGGRSKKICYFRASGLLAPTLPINHPSGGFSWQAERPWVEELLRQSYGT